MSTTTQSPPDPAISLDRPTPREAGQESPVNPVRGARGTPFRSQSALAATVCLVALTLLFFAANTASSPGSGKPAPDLFAALPESAKGWQVVTRGDLYRFAGVLRTEHLAERTYIRQGKAGPEQVTLYLAFWQAGQASAGLVGSHTPDACWPGSGWTQEAVPDGSVDLAAGAQHLPHAQHRLFQNEGYLQHVWFWQVYGGRVIDVGSTRSVPALIRIALKFGFRKAGQQVFIRVSSNRPWHEFSDEPFVTEFFARARTLGLY